MPRSIRSLPALFAIALVATAPFTAAQKPASPKEKGLRVFSCGHSFHMFIPPMLNEMAHSAGIDHKIAGGSSKGGSQVIQHWTMPDEQFKTKPALRAGEVDVLTLAPIWMPDPGIENFAKLAFEHNKNIRITVQEFWLPNDTYEPRYPLETRKKVDHDATDVAELKKHQDKYDHDVNEYCRGINQQLGKDVIVTVPVGQATVLLRQKIVAGEAPGLKKQWDLFRDTWGHAQVPLMTLASYCHYAVIYQRSPVGLPVPSALAKVNNPEVEKLNRLLQELAWQAVTQAPMSGVTAAK